MPQKLRVKTLIAMLEDEEWALPDNERARVHTALAYFCEPCDLIPDHVTTLGFLDDAIMVELVVEELRPEIEAYEDFIAYRKAEAAAHGVDPAALKMQRVDWAEARRLELIDRMRKRRGQSYQSSGGWKPMLFSFRG